MQVLEAKLKGKQIIEYKFQMNPEVGEVEISVETTAKFREPLDDKDFSGLVDVLLTAKAESEEDFKITMREQFIFEFDERPEDYQTALKSAYEKTVEDILSADLDKALAGIGRPPMGIRRIQ